jgi:hypothetical protein
MANGVHAPVNGVQPLSPHPPVDRVRSQAKRDELSTPNDPVLPPSHVRDCPIAGVLGRLTAHYAAK